MHQPKEQTNLNRVLKLVEQLSPDEQRQLGEALNKIQELREAVDAGIKQLDQGLGIPEEKAFEELRKRYQDMAQNK